VSWFFPGDEKNQEAKKKTGRGKRGGKGVKQWGGEFQWGRIRKRLAENSVNCINKKKGTTSVKKKAEGVQGRVEADDRTSCFGGRTSL